MRAFTASAILLSCCTIALGQPPQRNGRAIALFNVVTFPNIECQSTENEDNKGTCFSSTECSDKGGSAEGNCASGFGVCCIIRITDEEGGDVSHNNTIVENKDYPTAYTTASKKAEYKIKPLDDICFLRYDFIKLDLGITAATGVCTDTLAVAVPTAAGSSPANLCGLNDGQHMYTDNMRVTTETTLTIQTDTSTTQNRKWKIKISQIPCDSPVKPYPGCTQFYTENCGTFESFNYGAATPLLPAGFDVTICVRQNVGMCGTRIVQEPSTATKDTFGLPTWSAAVATTVGNAGGSVTQSADAAVVPAMTGPIGACFYTRFQVNGLGLCGGALNPTPGVNPAAAMEGTAGPISSSDFVYHLVNVDLMDVKEAVGYKINYKQFGCT